MFTYPDNIPDFLKSFPVGAQKIGVPFFNEHELKEAEEKSLIAIKELYIQENGEWFSKESAVKNENDKFIVNLSEAEFDDDKREVIATLIQEGWSKNKSGDAYRYYTETAIEDVSRLVVEKSRKMFIDHSKNPNRSMRDWVATITKESWVDKEEKGKAKAKARIKFTHTAEGIALYEDSKEFPEEVQISIDGKAKIRQGKVGEEKAALIENVIDLLSCDFVTRAAANGRVERIAASVENNILQETMMSLNNIIEKVIKQNRSQTEFYGLMDALQSFVNELAESDEEEINVDKLLKNAVKIFEEKIKVIIKDIKAVKNSRESIMKLQDFKKENAEAYEELREQSEAVAKVTIAKEMEDIVKKTETNLSVAQAELVTLKEENKTLQIKVDEHEALKKDQEKKAFIATKLEEAKLKVSETFLKILQESDEKTIEELIADRKEALAKNVTIDDLAQEGSTKKPKEAGLTEEQKDELFK